MNPQLEDFQTSIGIKFHRSELLLQSLVHRSSLNEKHDEYQESNERLEFLGDAVLEVWVSEKLYLMFPKYPEGDLTNLRSLVVRTETLAELSKNIGLNLHIMLSRGEETHGGRKNLSILADTFESLIGAIYLDQGMVQVDRFLDKFLMPVINLIAQKKIFKDPKSFFQELAQEQEGITPHYETLSESGPDHDKVFEVGLYLGEKLITKGTGHSKQKAEESAATAGIDLFSSR